jgi:drug/metabolite transporter (DMT)-like permease
MNNIFLYAVTVIVWGSSWIAITFQIGEVPEQMSIAYRFFLAALIMYVFCRLTGRRIRFTLSDHWRIALQGVLLFSTNFFLLYQCTSFLTSGLVSVIFSTLVVWNILGSALLFRTSIPPRVWLGAALGLIGISAVFWPELVSFDLSSGASGGLLLGIAGTLSASLGMLVSAKFQRRGLPVFETTTMAMFYGALFMTALNVVSGNSMTFEFSLPYIGSLLWLAVFASVIGFGCYLTLLGKIGPERAGYTSVLFPIVALTLSTLFEGFQWTALSLSGVALVLLGNVFILLKPKRV